MKRRMMMLGLLAIMALSACQRTAGFGAPAEPVMEGAAMNEIDLRMTVEPLSFALADRQRFSITLEATNLGDGTVDPELHMVQLLVNDVESTAWNLAVGNGRRPDAWFALPPDETVEMRWSSLGEALFPAAGEYSLIFMYGDRRLAPVVVQVTP